MLFISIVQKWITDHWTFQQAPTEHHFKSYSLLKQMYRVSKNECFCNVKEAYGQKNASEHFPLNSVWMVFITFGSLFVPGFLWLIWRKNRRLEKKMVAAIEKLKYENWHPNFNLSLPWKLKIGIKFDVCFSCNWRLKFDI